MTTTTLIPNRGRIQSERLTRALLEAAARGLPSTLQRPRQQRDVA